MRLLTLALLVMVAAAGCAIGPAGTPGGSSPDPSRTRGAATPDMVGAVELGALRVTRATALREEPSTGVAHFGALKRGDVVFRLDARGTWYRVWVPSVALAGWIEKGSAAPGRSDPGVLTGAVPVSELPVLRAKAGAHLRSGPSAKAEVIRPLEKGEPLRLLRQDGSWVKVFDPATKGQGYISMPLAGRPR